jgi:hypothetical protein
MKYIYITENRTGCVTVSFDGWDLDSSIIFFGHVVSSNHRSKNDEYQDKSFFDNSKQTCAL